MGAEGVDKQQQKVQEFLRLFPLTLAVAGLSASNFTVPATGLEIRPLQSRERVTVAARRFAAGVQELDLPRGDGPMLLKPGASQAGRPWLAQAAGAAVCSLAG